MSDNENETNLPTDTTTNTPTLTTTTKIPQLYQLVQHKERTKIQHWHQKRVKMMILIHWNQK